MHSTALNSTNDSQPWWHFLVDTVSSLKSKNFKIKEISALVETDGSNTLEFFEMDNSPEGKKQTAWYVVAEGQENNKDINILCYIIPRESTDSNTIRLQTCLRKGVKFLEKPEIAKKSFHVIWNIADASKLEGEDYYNSRPQIMKLCNYKKVTSLATRDSNSKIREIIYLGAKLGIIEMAAVFNALNNNLPVVRERKNLKEALELIREEVLEN